MRRLAVLVVAGAVLVGCGSITPAQATRDWMRQSSFRDAKKTLASDAALSRTSLANANASLFQLRTVCQVLFTDVSAALAALPTPDSQATGLLNSAYTDLGVGAHECYGATTRAKRVVASARIGLGRAELEFASIRLATVSAQ